MIGQTLAEFFKLQNLILANGKIDNNTVRIPPSTGLSNSTGLSTFDTSCDTQLVSRSWAKEQHCYSNNFTLLLFEHYRRDFD